MKRFSWERLIFALIFLFSFMLIGMVTFVSYQVAQISDAIVASDPVVVVEHEAPVEVEASPSATPVVEEEEEVEEEEVRQGPAQPQELEQ